MAIVDIPPTPCNDIDLVIIVISTGFGYFYKEMHQKRIFKTYFYIFCIKLELQNKIKKTHLTTR